MNLFATPLYAIRLPLSWLLVIAAFGSPAMAQFAAVRQNQFTVTEHQVDAWLTNSGSNGTSLAGVLTSSQSVKVKEIVKLCELSPEQQEQLELASQVDVGRMLQKIADLKAELVGKTFDANKLGEAYQKVAPLGVELRKGVSGPGSLFQKVLNNTVTPEQIAKVEKAELDRWRRQYDAAIGVEIAMIQRLIALTKDQREALWELFPDIGPPENRPDINLRILVQYQVSQIPVEDLEEVLDDAQIEALGRYRQRYSGYKQYLQQQGFKFD